MTQPKSEPVGRPESPASLPPGTAPRPLEITVRVIVVGLLLSAIMGAANVYLGLRVGMTVSASIPAAVVGMLILRGLLRTGTVIEANQVQTAASAGESLAAGIIFTMPTLVLIGFWTKFDFTTVTVVAFTGGLLGILLMIPMRRVFVTDNKTLPYPEGVACAAVLHAGDKPAVGRGSDAVPVIIGAVIGAAFRTLGGVFGAVKSTLEGAAEIGGRVVYYGGDVSPALVAVGLIVRLNIAVLIFIGGALAWLIGIPLLGGDVPAGTDPTEAAWTIWSDQIRYVGVGAMVVAGVASIIEVRAGLAEAVGVLGRRFRRNGSPSVTDEDSGRDLPAGAILGLSFLVVVLVAGTYYFFTRGAAITAVATATMIVMAFFFTAVASYIVGLVGNSNSPVSGMTITAVLFTGGMMWVFNFSGMEGMVATLGVAAIVCCVACTSGDVCNDLKTGHLVGATPWRQQLMQILGVGVAALVMAPVLQLLHDNTPGGIGGRELPAPQANLFASLARGFFGEGHLPWDMVAVGVVVGLIVLVLDGALRRRGGEFRLHLMPLAVGMYLPFGVATPILIGGIIAHAITRRAKGASARDRLMHRGVLFASGIIAGEALMGVGQAGLVSIGVTGMSLGLPTGALTAITVVLSVAVLVAFRFFSKPK